MATKDPEENKDDLRIGISCRDRDSGDIITFCASDGETLDELGSNNSIGILGDKENLPSFLQKNITVSENGEEMKAGEQTTENKEIKTHIRACISSQEDLGDVTYCASDTEDKDELGHISEEDFNVHLSKSRNATSTPDNVDTVNDTSNGSGHIGEEGFYDHNILSTSQNKASTPDNVDIVNDTSNGHIDEEGFLDHILPTTQNKASTPDNVDIVNDTSNGHIGEEGFQDDHILSKSQNKASTPDNVDIINDTKNGHVTEKGLNDYVSKSPPNQTSAPDNRYNVNDTSNDLLNDPNRHTTANVTNSSSKSGKSQGKSASRTERSSSSNSNSSSSSSSSASSSSSSEDADDSVLDPDFVNHVGTDNASTESLNSSLEIPSAQANSNGTVKKGRKRVAAPIQWIQNKRKRLRNTGQAYTTKRNKQIPARRLKLPCGNTCRLKCSNKITEDERRQIFEEYWKLGDINRQRSYIHHKLEPIKRKYRYTTTQKGRDLNRAFYLYSMGQKIRVCKIFFMRTLDINDRVIRTVISKHTATGEIENDGRGNHHNQPRVPEEIKNSVRNHINSIPRIESHYLRQQTTREFIDGGKTIADLHRDYQEERSKYNLPFANYVLYAKIFNTEFNLGFFVPKKDRCELCDSYENTSVTEKVNIEEKYNQHRLEKELARDEKREDKKKVGPDYIVAIYDLQAVLPCPKGEVSVFYYKSKLNTFNLTITELKTKDTECFLWHEGEGNRGADDIASCVYKYIENKINNSNQNVDVVFYSDSCCGQNKNQFVIALYIFAVLKFARLKSITHKYLIPGHTQNENDNAHSVIEKEIKRNLKSGPIYTPLQYAQIIKTAKKQGKPYKLNELSHQDLMSMKKLQADLKFSMKGLKISEVKIIKYSKESPEVLLYKKSYAETEFSEAKIWRRMPNTLPELKPAYPNGVELGTRKKADLISLIKTNHIPRFYASFYNTLLNTNE